MNREKISPIREPLKLHFIQLDQLNPDYLRELLEELDNLNEISRIGITSIDHLFSPEGNIFSLKMMATSSRLIDERSLQVREKLAQAGLEGCLDLSFFPPDPEIKDESASYQLIPKEGVQVIRNKYKKTVIGFLYAT